MKYIDADRLKCELEKRLKNVRDYMNGAGMKYKGPKYYKAQGKESAYDALLSVIDSLQQEQLPGIEENGIPGKDFIPVEWVDACEKYGKWKIVKVEQPEVDFEKEWDEFEDWMESYITSDYPTYYAPKDIARHFYELGSQSKPEVFDTAAFQKGVQEGRRLEREDVKSLIQSRIDEILGDAQPNPILRMELQELIKKIEEQ